MYIAITRSLKLQFVGINRIDIKLQLIIEYHMKHNVGTVVIAISKFNAGINRIDIKLQLIIENHVCDQKYSINCNWRGLT